MEWVDRWLVKECRFEIVELDRIKKRFVKLQGAMGCFLPKLEMITWKYLSCVSYFRALTYSFLSMFPSISS